MTADDDGDFFDLSAHQRMQIRAMQRAIEPFLRQQEQMRRALDQLQPFFRQQEQMRQTLAQQLQQPRLAQQMVEIQRAMERVVQPTAQLAAFVDSWERQRQDITRTLEAFSQSAALRGLFAPAVVEQAERILEETTEEPALPQDPTAGEVTDEALAGIREVLNEVAQPPEGMSRAARRAWTVNLVRAIAFCWLLQMVMVNPELATFLSEAGVGVLGIAWQAGTEAGKAFDKLNPPDTPEEND